MNASPWHYVGALMAGIFMLGCSLSDRDPVVPSSDTDDPPLEKVVVPIHVNNSAESSIASGFIVQYKGDYFLTTNYHIVTGRSWRDTTQFNRGYLQEPDTVWASFLKKSDGKVFKKGIPLRLGEKRLFINIFANKKMLTTPDIAFIKISDWVREINFKPVVLDSIPSDLFLKNKAALYCCSYRNKRGSAELICDTLVFRSSNGYTINSNYSQTSAPMEINNQGAPIYSYIKGKRKLVGIASESIPNVYPNEAASNYILTKYLMKMSLDSLVQKEAPEYVCKLIQVPEQPAITQNLIP
jgi:hypothetical protein